MSSGHAATRQISGAEEAVVTGRRDPGLLKSASSPTLRATGCLRHRVPSIPYYAELHDRRRQVILLERAIWILAPEDLAVLKLMFFRRKDLADVEAIFRDQGSSIDRDFVHRKLLDLVGKGDERLAALDEIEKDVDSRP